MDTTNKVISFILGLIVVIVVLLLITGKLGLFKGKNFFPISRGSTTTPTPTLTKAEQANKQNNKNTPTPRRLAQNSLLTATPSVGGNSKDTSSTDSSNIKTIPSTGSSTDLLAGMTLVLIGGMFLRKIRITS